MIKKLILITLLSLTTLLFTSCGSLKETMGSKNGFDQICDIYSEVDFSALKSGKQSIGSMLTKKLTGKVTSMVAPGPALSAFNAVTNKKPSEKYNFFQSAAQSSLKKKWSCMALKQAWSMM